MNGYQDILQNLLWEGRWPFLSCRLWKILSRNRKEYRTQYWAHISENTCSRFDAPELPRKIVRYMKSWNCKGWWTRRRPSWTSRTRQDQPWRMLCCFCKPIGTFSFRRHHLTRSHNLGIQCHPLSSKRREWNNWGWCLTWSNLRVVRLMSLCLWYHNR